jgi:hypothetical protein
LRPINKCEFSVSWSTSISKYVRKSIPNKNNSMKNFMILLSLAFSCGTLSAQNVFLVEHFNYPANDELRQHGWTPHSAAATNPLKVSPSGLAWSQTNYLGSGIGNAASIDNTGSDENRPLSTLTLDSGVVYTSFLARVNGTVTTSGEGFFFHVGQYSNTTLPAFTSINNGFRGRTFKVPGSSADKFKFGLTFNAASVGANTTVAEYDTGTTYLLVLKYEFFPGAMNDSVSLYIFADGDAIDIEPATPALGPFGSTASNAGDLDFFQLVALRQYNSAQDVTVDGIIVQDSWNLVPPLIAPNLLTPPDNTTLVVAGAPTIPASITWTSAQNLPTPIAYEWQLALRSAGNFNNPALVLPSDNMGADTTLSLTLGQIDVALASLGIGIGDTVRAMWRVQAIGGSDTLFSAQTFDIDLVRGTIVMPIGGFDLLSPPDQTVLSVGPNATGNAPISWRATTAGTQSVSYEWHAILPGGNFTSPLVSLSAGTDTALVLPLTAIDSLLNSLGVNPGDTVALDWTVEASAGTDSRLANQDWRITLIREPNVSLPEYGLIPEMHLYPNPAKSFVTLHLDQGFTGRVDIRLFDSFGQLVLEKINFPAIGKPINLDVNSFSEGTYIIQVSNGQKIQLAKLILK